MLELKQDYTIITVTHNMQQAARVADYTAFFHLGKLIEYDETETIFVNPHNKKNRRLYYGEIWIMLKPYEAKLITYKK